MQKTSNKNSIFTSVKMKMKSFLFLRSSYNLPTTHYSLSRGVTFIEITVVISIFSIIAGTLLLNFSQFSRNVSIQNLAQDIALQINAAQKDAISGLTSPLIWDCERATANCAPRYGVYFVPIGGVDTKFTNTISSSGTPVAGSSIIRFFDHTDSAFSPFPNGVYDPLTGADCGTVTNLNIECLDILNIGQGNLVSAICGKLANDPTAGDLMCDSTPIDAINISFKRPFPDAIITDDNFTYDLNGQPDLAHMYAFVRITITSPNIDTLPRDIVVTKLGRISIERTP